MHDEYGYHETEDEVDENEMDPLYTDYINYTDQELIHKMFKYELDYQIDNRNATPEEIKKKSSMSIPANSKLPIMRWEKATRKWTIKNKSASAA